MKIATAATHMRPPCFAFVFCKLWVLGSSNHLLVSCRQSTFVLCKKCTHLYLCFKLNICASNKELLSTYSPASSVLKAKVTSGVFWKLCACFVKFSHRLKSAWCTCIFSFRITLVFSIFRAHKFVSQIYCMYVFVDGRVWIFFSVCLCVYLPLWVSHHRVWCVHFWTSIELCVSS